MDRIKQFLRWKSEETEENAQMRSSRDRNATNALWVERKNGPELLFEECDDIPVDPQRLLRPVAPPKIVVMGRSRLVRHQDGRVYIVTEGSDEVEER